MKPKDKYENLLLALLEQRAGVEAPMSYPIGLIIDPSSVCQLNCVFCAAHTEVPKSWGRDYDMRTKTIMKLPLFRKILDEVGKYLFSVWLCAWGEPLLNPRLVEMVRIVKGYGIEHVGLSSNFSMNMTDETIYGLVESGLDKIILSIDGVTQEAYEKYRVKGSLAVVLSNLERLIATKKKMNRSNPYIIWQFLVFAHNEKELPEARKYAERLGVDFQPVAPGVDVGRFPEWLSSLDEYVLDAYKKKAITPEQSIDEVLESLSRYQYKECDWPYLVGVINSNGSVSVCCGVEKEADDFGSLDGKTFTEVWNNEMFRAARKCQKNKSDRNLITNVCTNCCWPQIKDLSSTLQNALAHCPSDVREKAKRLLPDHPLVKKFIAEEGLEAQIEDLLNSYSWRITAPLRAIAKTLGIRRKR